MEKENRKQYIFAIKELTGREVKRKYARSKLGIVWSILNPLLTMTVLSLIFSKMFQKSIAHFPIYFLTGSIFWNLFSVATNTSMTALVDNKTLLIKVKLPKQTFVLSRVYTSFINFGYSCVAYLLMLIVFRMKFEWTWLLLSVDILFSLLFALGIGYILSIVYVFFGDIKYLYDILLTLWMYLSAIFYPASALPEVMQKIVGMNPIYVSITFARICVIDRRIPEFTLWIKLIAFGLCSFSIGYMVFKKNQNKVMQKI